LDRIVKDKEGVKKQLEVEERQFLDKKRNYEKKMIDFEKQELVRRGQEIEEKKEELENMRRKNKMVQEKVEEQISSLEKKLTELKTEHENVEENCQAVIASLQDKLTEVESSLSVRLESYGEERGVDVSPSAPQEAGDSRRHSTNIYPSLTNIPRSWHQIYSATQSTSDFRSSSTLNVGAGEEAKFDGGSRGSSPQISLNSSTSSRSPTPRIDSDSSI